MKKQLFIFVFIIGFSMFLSSLVLATSYTVTIHAADPYDGYLRDWNIFDIDPSGTYVGGGVWTAGTPLMTSYFYSGATWSVNLNEGIYYLVIGQSGGPSYGTYSGEISINGVNLTFTGADVNNAIEFTVPLVTNQSNTTVCTDSDGGLNYYVKGTIDTVIPEGLTSEDYCPYPNTNPLILMEHFCSPYTSYQGNYTNKFYTCPYGCSNGACLGDGSTLACTDSDGGKNYNVKGSVTAGEFSMTDNCVDSGSILEWYCESNKFKNAYRLCLSGTCSNGACIGTAPVCGNDVCEPNEISCFDDCGWFITYTNEPVQLSYMGTDYSFNLLACGYISSVSAITITVSYDGIPVTLQILKGRTNTLPNGLKVTVNDIYCPLDNAGSNANITISSDTAVCEDSDGGKNYYTRGTITGTVIPEWVVLHDMCYLIETNGTSTAVANCTGDDYRCKLNENWCEGSSYSYEQYHCPYGCKDGACMNETEITCTDSDGGLNYFFKGNTSITTNGYLSSYRIDTCYSWYPYPYTNTSTYTTKTSCTGDNCFLDESKCLNNAIQTYQYHCPYGCSNGACLPEPEKCINHDECSQACDSITNFHWSGSKSNSWTGSCPSMVYGCMSGDCGIGQCNSTTGECFCQRTNVVDIYGNVCPSGTTCGDDLYCHAIMTCTDSDGGYDKYVQGTCTDSKGTVHTEECWSSEGQEGVSEWTCQMGPPDGKTPTGTCLVDRSYPQSFCSYGCRDGACLKQLPSTEFMTVVLGEDFYVSQTSSTPYMWRLAEYDESYLSYNGGGAGCSSTGKCSISLKFKALKEGTTKIILDKVNTNNNSTVEIKYVYVTIEDMIDYDLFINTDKYVYSHGDTVNIVATLTGEPNIDFSNAFVQFKLTLPDNTNVFLTPSRVGFVSAGCLQSETQGAYSCEQKSSYSFAASYTITQGSPIGIYKANVETRIGIASRSASTSFKVESDYADYVDIFISPESQTTTIGSPVSYRVTLRDKHSDRSRNYAYEIAISNLPYNTIYPVIVALPGGASTSFDINVFPSSVSTEKGIKTTTETIGVEDLNEYRQSSTTGAFILTSYPIVSGGGSGSIETVPIEVASFRFSVSATLSDDHTVKDSDSAVLYVKYSDVQEPPDFPEEEIVTDYLREGWNLLNLPGKGTSFVDTTCSLQRKPFAYVYLHDQRRYVSIQEAAMTMGIEPLFEYVSIHPLWIYSYENCEISVKVSKYATYSGMSIIEGWNMIGTTQDMVGETMNSIKGSCEFEKIYMWNSDSQNWVKISGNDLIEKISNGIVVKASSECNLKKNSIQPPIIS